MMRETINLIVVACLLLSVGCSFEGRVESKPRDGRSPETAVEAESGTWKRLPGLPVSRRALLGAELVWNPNISGSGKCYIEAPIDAGAFIKLPDDYCKGMR